MIKPIRRASYLLATATLLASTGLTAVHAQPNTGSAGPHKPCPVWSPTMKFDCYRDYAEQTAMLQAMAQAYPQLTELESIGKSYQGRELWVLKVTDKSTGAPESKPGVWIEGGVDSDEISSVETALAVAHRLLTATDPETLELRRTRTFYVVPNIMPDTGELYHHTALRPTDATMRPYDEDSDGLVDEDPPEDLDGDGEVTMMRWIDPGGSMVIDERDSRLLRPRRAGDKGPFYKTSTEGLDNDGDGKINEDWLGGVDPNRNYPNFWDGTKQVGSGPYAGSEQEIHALLEYNVSHPNIATALHLHSAGGVVLYPFGIPKLTPPPTDFGLYKDLARRGLEVTGYSLGTTVIDWRWPAGTEDRKPTQVWRDKDGKIQSGVWTPEGNAFAPEPAPDYIPGSYPAYGGSMDTTYPMFGILAFALELYEMAPDHNGDGKIDDVDRLIQNDKHMGGVAFKKWTPFKHPTLGQVEIGGWTKQGWNNPLPHKLEAVTREGINFAMVLAQATPLLSVSDVKVTPSEGGIYRIEAKISNLGQMPTELAIRKDQVGALPVKASLELPAGAVVLGSKSSHDLGVIDGFGKKSVEWVIRAPAGAQPVIVATHPKGGTARRAVPTSGTAGSGQP